MSCGPQFRVLPLAEALKAEHRDGFDLDLEDDCSAMTHPAWIPFAEDDEYEVFLINTNLRSRTFGEVMGWTLNCGEDYPEARSLSYFLKRRASRW
jgi:hypothetical protein